MVSLLIDQTYLLLHQLQNKFEQPNEHLPELQPDRIYETPVLIVAILQSPVDGSFTDDMCLNCSFSVKGMKFGTETKKIGYGGKPEIAVLPSEGGFSKWRPF